VRKLVVALLLLASVSTWALVAHAATPAADEAAVSWTATRAVHTWSRSVRVMFSYPVCGVGDDPVSRIVVERRRRTIDVTVLMHKPAPQQPGTACPELARVYRRTVSLHGRLGERSITDGSTGRVRVRRPHRG
jgi:hypothetical protein